MNGNNIFSEYGFNDAVDFESIVEQRKTLGITVDDNVIYFTKGVIDTEGNTSVPYKGMYDSIREQNEAMGYYDNSSIEYGKGVVLTDNALAFTALNNNATIRLTKIGNPTPISVEYSTDCGISWLPYTIGDTITIPQNRKIKFRGNNSSFSTSGSNYYKFVMTGTISASGDVTSLLNGIGGDCPVPVYCYYQMFSGCTGLTAAPELPATTLANSCYQSMFNGCTGLTTAPALPATTLSNNCYYGMFNYCTGLTTAPELPATTLADYCYSQMFVGCDGLTTAPELPATTLSNNCYYGMFADCTSLTTAPELPATTLANYCYCYMFSGCTGLTTAPALPATTLAECCYTVMFQGCTSLTTAPELPATTLANNCYYQMFQYCISLTTAPELPATTLADGCYYGMFYVCESLNSITCLATDISASDCTTDWLSDVAGTGTFTKAASMSSWTEGGDGIPSGWTVNDYSE